MVAPFVAFAEINVINAFMTNFKTQVTENIQISPWSRANTLVKVVDYVIFFLAIVTGECNGILAFL